MTSDAGMDTEVGTDNISEQDTPMELEPSASPSKSLSGPVRFQLKVMKRATNPLFRESSEDSTDGTQTVQTKLSKPRRVIFPTISEREFGQVVERIENAAEVKKWQEAFDLVEFLCARKCNERVMEMKAQLQLEVGENFEAVKNCERAIKLNPRWWEGHRTHGRCLLSLGESGLAVKAFERAIYINPADEDLRSEFREALGSSAAASRAEAENEARP